VGLRKEGPDRRDEGYGKMWHDDAISDTILAHKLEMEAGIIIGYFSTDSH
jgi:hypothetical protein